MARIRSIKPEFFYSETLAKVSLAAERTFCGLFTHVDDMGRVKDVPAVMNGQLWPMRGDHTVADLDADLVALADPGLPAVVCRYEVDGRRYLHLPSWNEHQRINKPTRSKLPPCPVHDVAAVAAAAASSPGQLPLEGDSLGKFSPQGQQEVPAVVWGPGSAASVAPVFACVSGDGVGEGGEGVAGGVFSDPVLRVTRFPGTVSQGFGATETVEGLPGADSGVSGADLSTFSQVSGLEGEGVLRVTRSPHHGLAEGQRVTCNTGSGGEGGDGPVGTFSQVSGPDGAFVSRVTHIPEFARGERKGTGKGKERNTSRLRLLDACARDASGPVTDQRGIQPTTSSPPGGNDADSTEEQCAGASSSAVSAQPVIAGGVVTGDGVRAGVDQNDQEQQMDANENQGALFDGPPPKAKRAPSKNMTAANKEIAKKILDPWWDAFASKKNGKSWGQSYGVVYSVLCSALANGLTEAEIKRALMILGPEKKPISGGTIQFSLAKAGKSAEAAVAEQSARRDPANFKHVL